MYMRAFYRCCLALLLALPLSAWATGEPSTYFNIFVPPNNDAVRRDPADNRIRFEDEVVGAIGPNDIAVWPKGYGSGGLIPAGTWLQYRIRFINKGT